MHTYLHTKQKRVHIYRHKLSINLPHHTHREHTSSSPSSPPIESTAPKQSNHCHSATTTSTLLPIWQLRPTTPPSPTTYNSNALLFPSPVSLPLKTMLLSTPFKDLYPSADPADSVLTINSFAFPTVMDSSTQRKRMKVDTSSNQFTTPSSFFNIDTVSTLDFLHRHEALDVDRLVSHHMERIRLELWAKWREFLRRAAANVAEDAARRLKAKEEELEQARQLNAALEERVRTLSVEAHIWRDLAETNEAVAHSLRRDLESALISCHRQLPEGNDSDAESCCDNYESEEKAESRKRKGAVVCRGCEEEEPSVLVLPCRHLCLCPACASRAPACLVCGCTKQCTVHVNLS